MERIPRLVIGACQGRSGKTTFTLGLLQALKNRGIKVQPFKKGPDYIDPSWLSFAAGLECRNLDAFMMDRDTLAHSFVANSKGKDISVVEGAMGLFDGLDLEGSGSTAEIAHIIDAPVILVVNCQRMTRSVAALVNGVVNFDPRITIGGVILNNVARSRHKNMLIQSIEKYCQVPVVGILPKASDIVIPDRHLGLIPAGERKDLIDAVSKLGQLVEENVDIGLLLELAQGASPISGVDIMENTKEVQGKTVTIGVIKDKAFSFYYPENLEALERAGARLVFIDALEASRLPEVDGLFIGGGFPEIFAQELAGNIDFKGDLKAAIEQGMPVYAECGGLMYLGGKIVWGEKSYEMVGALPLDVQMEKKPQGHGYTINVISGDNPFFQVGSEIKGHEFHNSKVINLDKEKVQFAYSVKRGKGITGTEDGIIYKNTLAAYNHIHASSVTQWAENFVAKTIKYKRTLSPT